MKNFFVLMIVLVIAIGYFFTRKSINFKSMVAGPACGETAPKIFTTKMKEEDGMGSGSQDGISALSDNAENWDQLVSKARLQNKRIMIMYVTSACGYCKLMKEKVLVNEGVSKMLSDNFVFITLQINETGKDNNRIRQWRPDVLSLSKEHGVKGVPNFTICDGDGKAVSQAVGFMDQQKFTGWVQAQL